MDDADLAEKLAKAKAGDDAAIQELLKIFESSIRDQARHRLPRALRKELDSMDIVQSIWTDAVKKDGLDLQRFETAKHFLGYLSGAVRNKVFEKHRERSTRKFDLAREEPIYVRKGDRDVVREMIAKDPSPSKEMQAEDRLEQMLAGRSPRERDIITLRRDGLTVDEIAVRLGIPEWTVRRVVDGARERMEARGWR